MDYGTEENIDQFNVEAETQEDENQAAVQAIFAQLREKPFRNASQRQEMVSYLSQLLVYDTVEVRRLFKEIGKLLNDLSDNGVIDNSSNEIVEEAYRPRFEETAKKFGFLKESNKYNGNIKTLMQMLNRTLNKEPSMDTFLYNKLQMEINDLLKNGVSVWEEPNNYYRLTSLVNELISNNPKQKREYTTLLKELSNIYQSYVNEYF